MDKNVAKLSLDLNTCKSLHFRNRTDNAEFRIWNSEQKYNSGVTPNTIIKNLGVYIDNKLEFLKARWRMHQKSKPEY